MPAPPPAAVQPNHPDPHQDRPSPTANSPKNTARLLVLVRALIDYGRHLAATLQKRTADTSRADVTRNFCTNDIAKILACITRGLLRAAALETRLATRPAHEPATPDALTAPSRRAPRAAPSVDPSDTPADPRLAHLPTPADIAAQVRRRPIGAVIADICRDLGIMPSSPLWREISLLIIANGGNLATLYRDINGRAFMWQSSLHAAEHPGCPALILPVALRPSTGPP